MAGYYYYDPMPPYIDYGQYYRPLPPYAFVAAPVVDAEKPKKTAEEKPKENDKKPKIIEMDVLLCCENCVHKIKKALHGMDGEYLESLSFTIAIEGSLKISLSLSLSLSLSDNFLTTTQACLSHVYPPM
jgi:copper chaperone CopZ